MKQKVEDIIIRDVVRDLTDSSLYEFNRLILKYPDINEAVHKPMCDFFQPPADLEENDYRMLLEPRNTFKTSLLIVGASIWVLAKNPNARIMILGISEDEAKKRLKVIKDKMGASDILKYFYFDLAANKRSSTWRADSITVSGRTSLEIEPSISAWGRGSDPVGNHFDFIFVDDLEGEKSTASEEELAATKRFFRRLSPVMLPRKSVMRICGTRWSFDDLYSMILGENQLDRDSYSFFKTRIRSAYNPDGSLYYPERLSRKFLEREKKFLGNYLFSANYLNNPVADEDAAFPPPDTTIYLGEYVTQGTAKYLKVDKVICNGRPSFKYIPREKSTETDLVQIRTYLCIDPALSEKEAACYTGIVVVGRDLFENRIWVIDALRLKSQDPLVITEMMLRLYVKYMPAAIVLEDIAYQLTLKTFFETEARKQHLYPVIQTVGRSDRRSKHERILGLSNFWKTNNLIFPLVKDKEDEANYIRCLLEELYHYPKSRTLDLADALSRVLDVNYTLASRNQTKNIEKIEKEYCEEWK